MEKKVGNKTYTTERLERESRPLQETTVHTGVNQYGMVTGVTLGAEGYEEDAVEYLQNRGATSVFTSFFNRN